MPARENAMRENGGKCAAKMKRRTLLLRRLGLHRLRWTGRRRRRRLRSGLLGLFFVCSGFLFLPSLSRRVRELRQMIRVVAVAARLVLADGSTGTVHVAGLDRRHVRRDGVADERGEVRVAGQIDAARAHVLARVRRVADVAGSTKRGRSRSRMLLVHTRRVNELLLLLRRAARR